MAVSCGKRQFRQHPASHPAKGRLWLIGRARRQAASNEKELHAVVIICLHKLGIPRERLHQEAGLFPAFADRGGFGRFAGLDLASRKFPESRQRHSRGALAHEEFAVVLNHGNGDGRGHGYDFN